MFEHANLDGSKYRTLAAVETFLQPEVLEFREGGADSAPRLQHGVAGDVLVERYLPAESVGTAWPHDSVAAPWWVVVDHPPHAGIVATFNESLGGIYKRVLNPEKNVVAFAEQGEEVVINAGVYSVVRAADSKELTGDSLVALRAAYYAN